MNIIFFIRLLWKHAVLLIVTPILLAIMVFFLTQNQTREYISSAKLYTGFSTGSSLAVLENVRQDFYGTKASFDNLIEIITSRNTAEEVGLLLFTRHMLLDSAVKEEISVEAYNKLMGIVPKEVKKLVVKGDFFQTYQNFKKYKEKDFSNFIYGLINYEHPHYSSKAVKSSIKVHRLQSSDLIEIVYKSDDPGICYQGLKILNDYYIDTYSQLKINQTGIVTTYFENQLQKAIIKLKDAEEELLTFSENSNIINYNEQTKHIASEKENFTMEYSKIRMEFASANSVLHILESKMTPKARTRLNSREILDLRSKFSEVSIKLSIKNAALQATTNPSNNLIEQISGLKSELTKIQGELREKINERYDLEYSAESIPTNQLLQDWLTNLVLMESTRAKMIVGKQRLNEIESIFAVYAPLGATLKSLERKITVSENEYLSLLSSLNSAKLRQQNVELNSNLRIIDSPLFPLAPEPGKRKQLLLIAFFIGFLIPASAIIALELLDRTIKRVSRAHQITKLNVVTPLPNFGAGTRTVSLDYVYSKGIDKIIDKIFLERLDTVSFKTPVVISLYSHYDGEGKSTIAQKLAERMIELGNKVKVITHSTTLSNESNVDQSFSVNINSYNNYDFIITEVPSIINNLIPFMLVKNSSLLFLVLMANRSWDSADDVALNTILEAKPYKHPMVILNGVEVTEMESVIGVLPKNRSRFRRLVKNVLNLTFFQKNSFHQDKKI